jgi:hypothetical protein
MEYILSGYYLSLNYKSGIKYYFFMPNHDLTEEEINLARELLSKLEPGFLPPPIFYEITRLTAVPIIEVVPLRFNSGKTQILLLPRSSNDPTWPNQLHVPGTVIRATDTMDIAFRRIFDGELNGSGHGEAEFVQNILHNSGRGMEASQIYWVEILDEPKTGQFYNANDLPQTLVRSQLDFISEVVKVYEEAAKS